MKNDFTFNERCVKTNQGNMYLEDLYQLFKKRLAEESTLNVWPETQGD